MAKKLTEHLEELPAERKAILNRLRRAEGQLRGIQRMIIEDRPCVEVLDSVIRCKKGDATDMCGNCKKQPIQLH
ncbi:metal-sensitive transcriptional regulator [Acetomicrobium sp.]|jgi:DNA-binding FrmR family transcriptional regulator|uniref:metal-sensitive transcriptional regulator n=1 Tax=Acetomicrobium sp. TaxID=1872099 RepID=UPI003D98512E